MLNKEAYLKTSPEVCTQIASYFDVVDSCIALSDTNHTYTINPQTSYSPSPPIQQGSYTSVIISPNSHNTADIYNGFIKADMDVTFAIKDGNKLGDLNYYDNFSTKKESLYQFDRVWFGFKDARDAIEKYEIVCNGNSLYTQNNACEESFLTACCANETTKRADIFSKARHKDIWEAKQGTRCGFIATWGQQTSIKGTIHLKIDLKRFLPLSNIKYLPAFAGKVELRLYFSCAGMVCCPIGPPLSLKNNPKLFSTFTIPNITAEFMPIGEPITVYKSLAHTSADTTNKVPESNILDIVEKTFLVTEYSIKDCQSIIPCFGINENIYNALLQRYSDPTHPLTFPTQTLSVYTTTNPLKQPSDKATVTITPRFVDSIFCLFPLKHTHHTYFKNPLFKSFYINAGGYGNLPARPFGTTVEYPEFLEYCQNAMNMNGEQTGFNKEVIASLCNKSYHNLNKANFSLDRSSFFIGIPTETDNTYQQGLTSLAPINFEINVTQDVKNDSNGNKCFAEEVQTPPLLCLLYDVSISFLVQPNGQPPLVRMGNYDLTTPE